MINKKYQKHSVFLRLQKYAEFYNHLSSIIIGFVKPGTGFFINHDTDLLSSMEGTIKSIHNILFDGQINDAYALLRKYSDLILINIYISISLKESNNPEIFKKEEIKNWLHGKTKLPKFETMQKKLSSYPKLKEINKLLIEDTRYKEIRARCNDHVHYNSYDHTIQNTNRILIDSLKILDIFEQDLEDLLVMHVSYLFYLNDHYMMSSDYEDHLDCEMNPPEGSQYFVAPFVQDIFDEEIKKKRNAVAVLIKKNTSMLLE